MDHFEDQAATSASSSALEDFEIEISDLPPDARSHYLLARLGHAKKRLQATTQTLLLNAAHEFEQGQRSAQETTQQEAGDFEIEISDLPPGARTHYLLLKLETLIGRMRESFSGLHSTSNLDRAIATTPALRQTQRRTITGRLLTLLGICAALSALIVGNVPGLRTRVIGLFEPNQASMLALESSTSGPVPITIGHFGSNPGSGSHIFVSEGPGPLPPSCPQVSTLRTFTTPLDPPGLGGGPVWISGFAGPTASLVNLQPDINAWTFQSPGAFTFSEWYETVAVFVQKGFTGNIILQGQNQENGSSLMFAYGDALNFSPSLTLNLSKETPAEINFEGVWEMIPVNILVPASGCYSLQAYWTSNSWTRYFAAGD